ncbi:MAG TPA: FkbM family methyltransferase [Myxococcota bacterium]|jgi:FkbM family methyltransferase
MSWLAHPLAVRLRNLGRIAGVNRWLAGLLAGPGYEASFERAVLASVQRGDRVWDVGANVGLYTLKLLEATGAEGRVYAFEPSPVNRARLATAVGERANAVVVPLALGDRDDSMKFEQGRDELGATSRLLDASMDGIDVRVARGDSLVAAGEVAAPNVIKIDVEGFELDVLRGLGGVLRSPSLRAIGIEVHFGILHERGIADAPRQLERLLGEAGYRCAWTDPSHVIASRAAP